MLKIDMIVFRNNVNITNYNIRPQYILNKDDINI